MTGFALTKRERAHVHIRRDRPSIDTAEPVDSSTFAEDPRGVIEKQLSLSQPGWAMRPYLRGFRHQLALADDPVRDDAVEMLDQLRSRSPEDAIVAAYLMPERREWFEHLDVPADPAHRPLWYLTVGQIDDLARDTNRLALSRAGWSGPRNEPAQLAATLADALGDDLDAVLIRWFGGTTYVPSMLADPLAKLAVRIEDESVWAALIADGLGRNPSAWQRDAIKRGMKANPALAARLFVPHLNRDDTWGKAQRPLVEQLVANHPDAIAAAHENWDNETRAFVAAIADATVSGSTGGEQVRAADGLPEIFAAPPWENRQKITRRTVALEPRVVESRMAWLDGERERNDRGFVRATEARIEDWDTLTAFEQNSLLFAAETPEEIDALRPYAAQPARFISARHIARYELTVHDRLVAQLRGITQAWEYQKWDLALPMVSAELAELAIDLYARRIVSSRYGEAWLTRHVDTAAAVLIPRVLSKERKGRAAGESVLRMLAGHDRPAVLTVAAGFGDDAATAIEAFLAIDPLQLLPSRIPAAPGWLNLAELSPPTLAETGAPLPRSAMGDIVTMLALSKDTPYAGLELAQAACDPDSLARFAFDLQRQWHERGTERKTNWACAGLSYFGNDSLLPLVDDIFEVERPRDEVVRRGLDAYERIGTDEAMRAMFLRAQRIKRKVTKRDALRTLDDMAAARGLTMEQLADITIPRFDLDDTTATTLDFGPRHFTVAFDQELRPVVRTDTGAVRTTLPKPGAKDDAALAELATKRFAKLKREVKKTATEQRKRFEAAMVVGRRWTVDEFVANFVDHPLMVHLVGRLVWGFWARADAPLPTAAFRLAEDGTWADVDDAAWKLPDGAEVRIGIAHPLELGADLDRWRATFDDYEIGQPFEQLVRAHVDAVDGSRWTWSGNRLGPAGDPEVVPYQRVLGMASRGWKDQQVGAQSGNFSRDVHGGRAHLEISPRFTLGQSFADQTLAGIALPDGPDEIDSVALSEAIRDLEWLTRA